MIYVFTYIPPITQEKNPIRLLSSIFPRTCSPEGFVSKKQSSFYTKMSPPKRWAELYKNSDPKPEIQNSIWRLCDKKQFLVTFTQIEEGVGQDEMARVLLDVNLLRHPLGIFTLAINKLFKLGARNSKISFGIMRVLNAVTIPDRHMSNAIVYVDL